MVPAAEWKNVPPLITSQICGRGKKNKNKKKKNSVEFLCKCGLVLCGFIYIQVLRRFPTDPTSRNANTSAYRDVFTIFVYTLHGREWMAGSQGREKGTLSMCVWKRESTYPEANPFYSCVFVCVCNRSFFKLWAPIQIVLPMCVSTMVSDYQQLLFPSLLSLSLTYTL